MLLKWNVGPSLALKWVCIGEGTGVVREEEGEKGGGRGWGGCGGYLGARLPGAQGVGRRGVRGWGSSFLPRHMCRLQLLLKGIWGH